MELKDLFYKWVPVWVKVPALFILFFVVLTANGIYLGNSVWMYSGMGVYSEPFTEAYNAVYIGMGIGLLFEWRIKLRFSSRASLLWGFSIMLLVNIVNMKTDNPALMVIGCLILGFAKIPALIEIYIIWLAIWSKKLDTRRLYPFVYLVALGGVYFITYLTAQFAEWYNWRYAYILMIMLILLCLLLVLIFVQHNPLRRPMPLYQMDVFGGMLLTALLLLLNYVAVYGRTEDWWESDSIAAAMVGIPTVFLAFVLRELLVKRPIIPFSIFCNPSFLKGLLFFFLLGIFLPSSIQGAFTAGVLDFENIRNAELNLYLIPGVLAAAVLSYSWYYFGWNTELLLFAGVAAFAAYYFLLYTHLANGLGMEAFWPMSVLKGFGTTTMYVAIGLFTTSTFKLNTVMKAAGVMILSRSFLGTGILSGVYSYLLYAGRVRHLDLLAGSHDADAGFAGRPVDYYRTLQAQAAMAASKELCGYIVIIGVIILVAILFSHFYRLAFNKRRILN